MDSSMSGYSVFRLRYLIVHEASILSDQKNVSTCPTHSVPVIFLLNNHTLREWRFVRLRGSRENWGDPLLFLLTRYLFWLPVDSVRVSTSGFLWFVAFMTSNGIGGISLTDNLPDEISRYVGRHFAGDGFDICLNRCELGLEG